MKKDWEIRKMVDVCDLITCGVAARPKYVEVGIPFLSAKNVKDGKVIWSGYNCVSEKTHLELTKNNKPERGDILYTRVGSFGEAAVIEDNYEFSVFVSLTLIKVNLRILNNYFLKYYLNSNTIKMLAKKSISGSGVGNLNVGTVRLFPIPLPPLPEQQRIVSFLDEAFASIAKAKANAERNLKNSRELFESYLQSVFAIKEKGWEEKRLSELCKTGAGGTPLKAHRDYYDGGTIPWLLSGEVSQGEIFEARNFITEKGLKNSSARLFPSNTVLIAMYGATAGQVGILRFECSTNQAVCGILPNKNFIPEFIFYKFLAGKQALIKQAVGGAQPNISQIKIKNTLIPVISIKDQQCIVQKLDYLSSETKKLEAIYHRKLNDLEDLKKSILQKAFNGELKTS